MWFHISGAVFASDIELTFIERIYMTIRATCFASIPLLGNMLIIPILIFFLEKCKRLQDEKD